MSVRRVLASLFLALAVVTTTAACTDVQEQDDDAPSQQAPGQAPEQGDEAEEPEDDG